MSCILRVFGSSLDIGALLARTVLEADRVWIKGEPRFQSKSDGETLNNSGANFLVSEADMSEFDIQIKEASAFLEKNQSEIEKMVLFPGVEGAVLDFGVELRDVAIHSDYLSPELIQVAAKAGVGIRLSHYPCISENER
jgi:hypothetical protein